MRADCAFGRMVRKFGDTFIVYDHDNGVIGEADPGFKSRAATARLGVGWTSTLHGSPCAGALCCVVLNARVLIEQSQTAALVGCKSPRKWVTSTPPWQGRSAP
jgi:hypothetical protein